MQLLVSVRNAEEARVAIAAGCAVLDVKEPAHGSLGAASPEVWRSVADVLELPDWPPDRHTAALPRLSLALGEVSDWEVTRWRPPLPSATGYLKIGLAGLGSCSDWQSRWLAVRNSFAISRPAGADWIAVAYVDHARAESPPLAAVAAAAIETDCRGVLLDTWDKTGGTLWDHITTTELDDLAGRLHAAGVMLAAAGRVRAADFARLAAHGVDLVGVRSAACVGFQRQATISALAIAQLNDAIALTVSVELGETPS